MIEVTSDWSKFGTREIDLAKELLSHIKEINSFGEVKVMFNTGSGNVFLSDEDLNVWMINNTTEMSTGNIESWYWCSQCGHEGFKEDMKHGEETPECQEYLKEIGVIQ